MIRHIYILGITLLLCFLAKASHGQAVTLEIECFQGEQGTNVCTDIVVYDFIDITSAQFGIQYDPDIIIVTDVPVINLDNASASSVAINNPNGVSTLVWFFDGMVTIPDGGVMMTLCFDIIGDPGEISPLTFVAPNANSNNFIEIGRDEMAIEYELINCEAEVICGSFLSLSQDVCPSEQGQDNGSATFSLCCGQGPFLIEYALTSDPTINGQVTQNSDCGEVSVENLPPGTYDTRVTDANGLQTFGQFTIGESDPVSAQWTVVRPGCPGQTSGDILIDTIVGGTSPYRVEWYVGDSLYSRQAEGLLNVPSGDYSLLVTDSLGCTFASDITIDDRTLTLQSSIGIASCPGVNDGSIVVTLDGGTPDGGGDFTYMWDDGTVNIAPSGFRLNLSPGQYIVSVQDANGCEITDTFNIGVEKIIGANVTVDSISCPGGNDGRILVNAFAQGGSEALPYTFQWGNNAPPSTDTDNSSEITNLNFQNYTLTVADQDGCTFDTMLSPYQPDDINILWINSQETVSCNGEPDGEIRVLVTGGTPIPGLIPPYMLDWGDNIPMEAVIDSLPGDSTYTVIVTDGNGCMDSLSIYLPLEATTQIIDAKISPLTCANAADASIEVTVAPSDLPNVVEVLWDHGDTGYIAQNLSAGNYTIRITNQDGCVTSETYAIDPVPGLEIIDIQRQQPSCSDEQDGQIIIFIAGAVGDAVINWDHPNGTNNTVLPSIGAGTYTVTITDDSDCPALVQEIVLGAPVPIAISVTDLEGTSCPDGVCDGAVQIELSGGPDPSAGYQILWSNGSTDTQLQGLCPGYISLTVTNTAVCGITDSILIPSPSPIGIGNADITPPRCFGEANGSVTVQGDGGSGPYTFQWLNPSTSGPTLANIGEGSYVVDIIDDNGCTSQDSVFVMQPEQLVAQIDSANSNSLGCTGQIDGQITVIAQGGTPDYTYNWMPNVSNTSVASNLDVGNYSITVSDANGCQDVTNYSILGENPIEFQFSQVNSTACFGDRVDFTVFNASGGGGGPYSYTINNGVRMDLGDSVMLLAGDYLVSVFDNTGCGTSQSITVSQPSQIQLSLPDTVLVDLGMEVTIDAQIMHTLAIDTILWTSQGDSLLCQDALCESISIRPLTNQQLNVLVIDENGCSVQGSVWLIVDDSRDVYIPNAFSPNGDGLNDAHLIYTQDDVEQISYYRVFNRWGQLVHEAQNITNPGNTSYGWDGTISGELANPGVFIYAASIRFLDGREILYRGDLTLLR